MAKIKPIQDTLLSGTSPGSSGIKSSSSPPSFAKKLLRHPDVKEASALIAEQAGLEFDVESGAELEQLNKEIDELNARYKVSCKTLDTLEKKLSGTKRTTKSGKLMSGKDDGPVRWKDWRGIDKTLICVILALLLTAMVMGAGNVYAVLISSGDSAFIEDPWLAVMLSMLVPIASTSIKFVTNFMVLDSSRKAYAISVYGLTLVFLLAWGVLFSLNFSGVAGGFDWETVGEANSTANALVAVQLFCEVLSAASLFLACEEIYIRYAPYIWVRNSEYVETDKALVAHLSAHQRLSEQRGKKHGKLLEISAARKANVNNQVAEFFNLRARYAAANDPSFNA